MKRWIAHRTTFDLCATWLGLMAYAPCAQKLFATALTNASCVQPVKLFKAIFSLQHKRRVALPGDATGAC